MNNKILQLKNTFIVQDDLTQVIGDVNITVYEGEFVYIVGKTGSGKSSFLKSLYGELKLKDGEATFVGFDLVKLKKSEIPKLRRSIGMVFQDFQLLPDRSVYKNLSFVLEATGWKLKPMIQKRIYEVLESLSIRNIVDKMPHQLSGGEQQRAAIARALLNVPPIILADEPTGNLDPEVADEILSVLQGLTQNGTAVIMATHDYRLINKFPGTVYRIEDGILDKTTLYG